MAEGGGQEKTEQPTPRRLSEARRKGNVAKSMDTNTAVMMLASIVIIRVQFSEMSLRMSTLTEEMLGHFPREDFTTGTVYHVFMHLIVQFALIAGPTLIFLTCVGLLVNYLQVGVLFSTEAIKPSFAKINPITGFGRLFSRRSLVETLKALVKMTVVTYIVWVALAERYPELAATAAMDRGGVAMLFGSVAWEIAWRSVMALLIFGILDLFYQRWEHTKGLKMTRQEIKDEAKQSEGDPIIKGRIRRAQRDAARRRMMSEVPKATVVITNPTHFAVALKYDRDNMAAPLVVAKGMDLIAQKIKEIAGTHGVPMIENVPLARELYRRLEIQDEIPEDLYATVAEILVMVQKLNNRKRPQGLVVPPIPLDDQVSHSFSPPA